MSERPEDGKLPTAGASVHQMEQPAAKVEDVTAKGEAPVEPPPVPAKPVHPVIALLACYRAIFATAWAHRDELAGPRRLSDEAAFLPAALSLQDTPVHPAPRRLAYAIMALFVIALVWSIFGQIDIVAVAPGRVVVSERTKLIQPLERSVVKRVLISDGDRVAAGQALVELDPTAASADKTTAQDQHKSALSEVLRVRAIQQALQAVKPGAPPSFELDKKYAPEFPADWAKAEVAAANAQLQGEWGDVTAKLAKLSSEINRRQAEIATARAVVTKLEITVPMVQARETDFKKLVDQGYVQPRHPGQDPRACRAGARPGNPARPPARNPGHAARKRKRPRRLPGRSAPHPVRTRSPSRSQTPASHPGTSQSHPARKPHHLKAPVAGVVQQLAIHTQAASSPKPRP